MCFELKLLSTVRTTPATIELTDTLTHTLLMLNRDLLQSMGQQRLQLKVWDLLTQVRLKSALTTLAVRLHAVAVPACK